MLLILFVVVLLFLGVVGGFVFGFLLLSGFVGVGFGVGGVVFFLLCLGYYRE